MRFTVLGPLELVDGHRSVPLGPPRQRAMLAYLLLNANRVVATSKLISALWPGEVPVTARQMLQNSVSAARGVLAGLGGEPPAVLLTHAPGYLLRVDPDLIDLHRFRRLTERGRAELAGGAVQDAARTLRHALSLWRGAALADLVEGGVEWPSIAAIDSERYDLMESLFEAELACGRHQEVVSEVLEAARHQPMRGRLTEHAVTALTRCGRSAEAEQLMPEVKPRLTLVRTVAAERKHVSVVLVLTESPHDDPEEVDAAATRGVEVTREEVERLGGTVGGVVGPMSMALFGVPHTRENDTGRAVRAACAIRDVLVGQGVRVAVASGEALVRGESVTGVVVDTCLRLVHATPPGGISLCEATRAASERVFPHREEPPFVDREREMAVLTATVGAPGQRRRPQLVTVLGEPGIGKTRLVTELARRTGGIVRSTSFEGDADLVTEHGTLLVIDDVHLASEALLDRIGELAATTTVVVTARPELLESRPDWAAGRAQAVTLTLEPLSDNAIVELVGRNADRATAQALAQRVAGNPLFALAYLRNGRVTVDDLVAVPHAVHAVIAAQLDALPPEAKAVVHAAAVVGDVVWPGAVAAITEHADALAELVRRGVLVPTGRTTIDTEYAFRGSLFRDVAYARIPRVARAEKHQAVARWMAGRPTKVS